MASRLNPYLNFNGNTREAMEFYKDVFGGELVVSTFGQYGGPDEIKDNVMHAMLESPDGFTLMASDPPPHAEVEAGTNFSISLSGDDDAKLRGYWDKLSAGGTIGQPLEKQMWGDTFGQCVDKFGISWLVNITQGA